MLKHSWLRDAKLDDLEGSDDEHNFHVSLSFGRQECNLNAILNGPVSNEDPTGLQTE